ncbi:MAG TPA: pilus assembly protein PilM [Solirubrobacteraceae bacterium]|jgi:type IV pilus assembly protein PilM|nr:pilus assembly protein PilM [Solirubrobacteraceae bacterium]
MSLSSLAKTEITLSRLSRRPSPSNGRPGRRARRSSHDPRRVAGLDIQPGEVIAAQVHLDGGIVVDRAVAGDLDPGLVRDGEVADPTALGERLRDFFAEHDLPRTVRVGAPSKRAVMRVIDLPPMTDRGDVAAAVRLQAADYIAMPLDAAVVDHQVVGTVSTPDGPRTRAVVVAVQRESIRRLLDAVRHAGLRPVGADLAAFALTRATLRPADGDPPAVLHVHVAGVTTLAIARGSTCELTRVSAIDLEQLSRRLASREGNDVAEARTRLLAFGGEGDDAALAVLDAGLADLADDLGKTIAFHAAEAAGPPVAEVRLSGPVALIPNFPDVLAERLGTPVRVAAPAASPSYADELPLERVAMAAGLAVEEVPA